jgi:hypothetical protein
MMKEYTPTKALSPYTRIALFGNSEEKVEERKRGRVRRRERTPMLWNVSDEQLHPIKSRSRLEDFTRDSVRYLFPDKSPSFSQTKPGLLPPIESKEKVHNKKHDTVTAHREALLRFQKQGFLITRNK